MERRASAVTSHENWALTPRGFQTAAGAPLLSSVQPAVDATAGTPANPAKTPKLEIDRNAFRVKGFSRSSAAVEFPQHGGTTRVELVHRVVFPIDDVQVAARIDSDGTGAFSVKGLSRHFLEFGQRRAGHRRTELVHRRMFRVAMFSFEDVHVAEGIDREATLVRR